MLDKIFTLQVGGYYGGSFGELLAYMEQVGFFAYVLPFLLIFALVFGILTRTQIFKNNKAINGVIAFVVGLLALQFNFVPVFFSEIFPRLGIGLAVILALLILAGLFFDPNNKWVSYGLLVVGVIVFIVVIIQTAGWVGWYSGFWWYDNWPKVLLVLVVIGILAAIIASAGPKKQIPELKGFWAQPPEPQSSG
ncbi:hypothetical protein ES703_01124 [subsurface metagenome]